MLTSWQQYGVGVLFVVVHIFPCPNWHVAEKLVDNFPISSEIGQSVPKNWTIVDIDVGYSSKYFEHNILFSDLSKTAFQGPSYTGPKQPTHFFFLLTWRQIDLCKNKLLLKYSKNWLKTINIKLNGRPKVDPILKLSNYEAMPAIRVPGTRYTISAQ